jgi:hypothetical protein
MTPKTQGATAYKTLPDNVTTQLIYLQKNYKIIEQTFAKGK